ncbi:protein SPEC3 [Elysia marginata]|uniref:Protein SPEC3 n=1 Tax=Elysia marginata TaxID=1093978 RepID=A0AAV4GE78_9GAST|nr:protein SPEC3 [Elysia marginata]
MQVVYSGGSNTPTPSPRLQRKTGYGRPVMPGYMTHVHPQILVQRSREKLTEGDITLRDSIPAMSKGVAIMCLVLNIFIPGSGTLASGLSVLCCSQVRPKQDTKRHCIWVNGGVALLQFLLTFLFLLGWIWSITWGLAFLAVSKQFYYKGRERVVEADGKEGKGHYKNRSPRYTGPMHAVHTSTGSRAGSSGSLNRIATDNARTEHEKGGQHQHNHSHHHHSNHHHHHHQQQNQRHNSGGRNSPSTNHENVPRHQNVSKQADHERHPQIDQQQLHPHYSQHDHHEVHGHQQKRPQKRSGHYHQQRPNSQDRVRLYHEASDDNAVIPPEEITGESVAFNVDLQNQTTSSHTPIPDLNNLGDSSKGAVEFKNTVVVTDDLHNSEAGLNATSSSHIATLPNSTTAELESSVNATPVLTLPVAPYTRRDDTKERRHRDLVALQPIITLQKVPENSTDVSPGATSISRGLQSQDPDEKVMRARTRHEKMLQRKMSDNDLSPFELTNQQLAAIIIHDFPIQSPAAAQSSQDQPVMDGLPKC